MVVDARHSGVLRHAAPGARAQQAPMLGIVHQAEEAKGVMGHQRHHPHHRLREEAKGREGEGVTHGR